MQCRDSLVADLSLCAPASLIDVKYLLETSSSWSNRLEQAVVWAELQHCTHHPQKTNGSILTCSFRFCEACSDEIAGRLAPALAKVREWCVCFEMNGLMTFAVEVAFVSWACHLTWRRPVAASREADAARTTGKRFRGLLEPISFIFHLVLCSTLFSHTNAHMHTACHVMQLQVAADAVRALAVYFGESSSCSNGAAVTCNDIFGSLASFARQAAACDVGLPVWKKWNRWTLQKIADMDFKVLSCCWSGATQRLAVCSS
jgi:hypothetical protein